MAHYLIGNESPIGGTAGPMGPEKAPAILWGQGVPTANAPFTMVQKGSLHMVVDATDNATALYIKVDEGGDADDWTRIFAEDHALIATGSIAATGSIKVEQVETNARSIATMSALVNISDGDEETIPLYCVAAATITRIDLVWQEATAASGAAEGDVTIGNVTGGAQHVTAVNGAYAVSQLTGANQNLTITSGTVAADGSVFQSHDIAAGAAGTYHCQYIWDFDS